MKIAILALLSLLVTQPPSYVDIVRAAGCDAPVHESSQVSSTRSFHLSRDVMTPDGRVYERGLYIGTSPSVPADVTLLIVLHETGHCLQHQEMGDLFDQLYQVAPQVLELDADRRAADLACRLGLDGPAMLTRAFEWLRQEYGYEGDPAHGSVEERVAMSVHASACHALPSQNPIMS